MNTQKFVFECIRIRILNTNTPALSLITRSDVMDPIISVILSLQCTKLQEKAICTEKNIINEKINCDGNNSKNDKTIEFLRVGA